MCTYNGERFIKEQIDSILNQTYTNLELIITDDGSTDSTIEIIKNCQKDDNRIKLYVNDKNLGFVKNFERAISLCSGDLIALADQDDIGRDYKLEIFSEKINDNVLIYSDAILIDENSKETGKELIRPKKNMVEGRCNKAFLLANCVSGNTLMFKKELVEYILPIPQAITFHDTWIAFVASSYGSITFTDEALTYYRRYSEQVTNQRKSNYKSFLQRYNFKKDLMLTNSRSVLNYLKEFKKLNILKDRNTLNIIEALIGHYENYSSIHYNTKLYKILKRDKEEIYAITKDKKRQKKLIKTSIGLKLHEKTFFIL